MGILFELHRFNEARYRQLLPVLRALVQGRVDPALPDILRECLAVIETEEHRRLNPYASRDFGWIRILRRCDEAVRQGVLPPLSQSDQEVLPDILIGLYCMPRFQSNYLDGPESDTLVTLNHGGLISHMLSSKAPWFQDWFEHLGGPDARYEEFRFGIAMIILRRDQVRALAHDLAGMEGKLPEDASPYLIPTWRRLVKLVQDVLDSDDTLAWTDV